jgi:hypothetical protein
MSRFRTVSGIALAFVVLVLATHIATAQTVKINATATATVGFAPPDGKLKIIVAPTETTSVCARSGNQCKPFDLESAYSAASAAYLAQAGAIAFNLFNTGQGSAFQTDINIDLRGGIDPVTLHFVFGSATVSGTLLVDGLPHQPIVVTTGLAGLDASPSRPQLVAPVPQDKALELNCHSDPNCNWSWFECVANTGACPHIVEWPILSGQCWNEICAWCWSHLACGCDRNVMVVCPPLC